MSPFQPPRRHKKVTSITHATLLTISIVAAIGLDHAQVLAVPQGPAKSVPVVTYYGVESDPRRQSDQVAATLCSLRAPDTATQSKAKPEPGTTVAGSTVYSPLSPHCKLDLFLKQTYSPIHSPRQLLGQRRLRPRASGRTMVEVCKVGENDSVRPWRTQNPADSSRGSRCLRCCIRTLDISTRRIEGFSLGFGIP